MHAELAKTKKSLEQKEKELEVQRISLNQEKEDFKKNSIDVFGNFPEVRPIDRS